MPVRLLCLYVSRVATLNVRSATLCMTVSRRCRKKISMQEVAKYPASHVVITGGEPVLQLTASFVNRLHSAGKYVQIETNGTAPLPAGCSVDWVTCSPKYRPVKLEHIDELKVVFTSSGQDMSRYDRYSAAVYCLQPCDVGDRKANARILKEAISYCMAHPKWRLSLQTHKLINVR